MAFYCYPCPHIDYELMAGGLLFALNLKTRDALQNGDTLRLEEVSDEGQPTGRKFLRQIIRFYHPPWSTDDQPAIVVILVPLDFPPLQQLELTNPDQGTFVFWVGSHAPFTVGDNIWLLGVPHSWEITQQCVALAPGHIPDEARVGFLGGNDARA